MDRHERPTRAADTPSDAEEAGGSGERRLDHGPGVGAPRRPSARAQGPGPRRTPSEPRRRERQLRKQPGHRGRARRPPLPLLRSTLCLRGWTPTRNTRAEPGPAAGLGRTHASAGDRPAHRARLPGAGGRAEGPHPAPPGTHTRTAPPRTHSRTTRPRR